MADTENLTEIWTSAIYDESQFELHIGAKGKDLGLVGVTREAAERGLKEWYSIIKSEQYNDDGSTKYLVELKSLSEEVKLRKCITIYKTILYR